MDNLQNRPVKRPPYGNRRTQGLVWLQWKENRQRGLTGFVRSENRQRAHVSASFARTAQEA